MPSDGGGMTVPCDAPSRAVLCVPHPARAGSARLDTAAAERTTLAGIGGIRLDLLHGPVRPYVLAGVGAFSVKDAVEPSGTTRDFSNVNFGVDGGAGLSRRLGPIGGFVEARLQNVYTKRQGLIDATSIRSVPVTSGLAFRVTPPRPAAAGPPRRRRRGAGAP